MTTLTKRILRTLVALCLVAVLCVGTLQVSAASQTTITYLALGDSITAGYGLTNPSTEGFVAKFADAISDADTSVITVNAGESGLTADALVTALSSGSYDTQLAAADVITLTIGGNDLMAAFYETVATLYTANENSGTTYTSQDVQTWLSAPTTYSTEVSTIISLISTDSGKATLTAAVGVAATACVTDIEAIVGLIRVANTDAVILLANQYNPYTVLSSIPTYSTISTLFATATSSFNTLLAANTTIASNCSIVDLYNAGVSTNVNLLTMNLDFHPNATGHTTIANAMATAYAAATAVPSTDYVTVGTAELHDGYYTTDGVTVATTIPTDNYAYYSGGVLYLKNFTYAATSVDGIYSSNDSLIIDLCNSSSSISAGDIGVYSAGDLTVTNGSLTVSAEYGIAVTNGDVVISDCTSVTVLATGGYGIIARNYNDSDHSITISDSTVNVTATTANGGNMAGIVATGDVNISGSTVSVTVDCEEVMGAIWSMGGNISITDESTVTAEATAETYNGGAISAMWSETGNITISKSEVTASSVCTNSTAVNYGAIFTEGNISIMDSTVTAEAISTVASGGAITSLGDSGSITISNSEITASSVCTSTVYETVNCGAICTKGDISITDSEVTASTNGGVLYATMDYVGAAICSVNGSILISGSDINATVDSSSNYWTQHNVDVATAIVTGYGDIVIEANSKVTIDVKGMYAAIGIGAWNNLTISESEVEAKLDAYISQAIVANKVLVIEDCDNISATATGEMSAIGIYCTDIGITGSSVNIKATVGNSGVELYGIVAGKTVTITASEVIADGGIYIDSSTGTVTVTPATGGSLKITKTNASATDISTIDEATVISTSGYTYVAITEHVHAYNYNNIAWTWTDYENVTAAVTCTDTDCDHTVTVDATVSSSTTPATCTADGETVYTAKAVFGTTEYTDIASVTISATGHSYEAVVTAPTCTEKGYTTYTCSVCGDTYTDNETEALGHKYEAVVTAPTCTEQGYTTHTCSVCGDGYVDTYTAALGHSYEFQYFTWSNDLSTATATFKCKTCGELYTVDATITGEGDLGISVHTATVTFEGETYTDSQLTGTSLTRVSADYTAVNEAIEKANALNASDYSNFDLVTAAIDAVNWNLNILNQELVNTYAENIEAAIANLKAYVEETVAIDEPVEDSTTETEQEEAEVSEQEAETNPTTGVVVALLPMAVAIAGAIIGKQKLA